MREIIFRGKAKYGKRWIYGYHFKAKDYRSKEINYIVHQDTYYRDLEKVSNEILPETIGQYIGMEDKNGQKIFENDIIKHYYGIFVGEPNKYRIGRIEWDDNKLRFCNVSNENIYGIDACTCSYEVIGNIYDNPELLNPTSEEDV